MESTLSPQAAAQEILTVEQVADRLQLKTSWVYAHADQLGAYRTGKYLRFRWQRVLERLEQSPIETPAIGTSMLPLRRTRTV